MESFFGSMQIELLDRRTWATRSELGQRDLRMDRSVLQPHPPPLRLGYLSPVEYERLHTAAPNKRHDHPTETVRKTVGRSHNRCPAAG